LDPTGADDLMVPNITRISFGPALQGSQRHGSFNDKQQDAQKTIKSFKHVH